MMLAQTTRTLAIAAVAAAGLLAALATDLSPTGRAASPVVPAVAALERSDFATAFHLLRPFAEHGESQAQLLLSVMYAQGMGVSQDAVQARRWLRLAAANGNPQARSMMARQESPSSQSVLHLARRIVAQP